MCFLSNHPRAETAFILLVQLTHMTENLGSCDEQGSECLATNPEALVQSSRPTWWKEGANSCNYPLITMCTYTYTQKKKNNKVPSSMFFCFYFSQE